MTHNNTAINNNPAFSISDIASPKVKYVIAIFINGSNGEALGVSTSFTSSLLSSFVQSI